MEKYNIRQLNNRIWTNFLFLMASIVLIGGLYVPKAISSTKVSPPTPALVNGGTVDVVRQRGVLRCGIGAISEYAWRDETGQMRGFRADLCRAVAAAVLNAPDAVEFVPLVASMRVDKLNAGDVDLLIAGTTWTLTREGRQGVSFTTPALYDGQGFIAHRSLGITRLADLTAPAKACVITDTTNERNLAAYIAESGLPLTLMPRNTQDGIWSAFLSHTCDLITGDQISLQLASTVRTPQISDYVVLEDIISREPLTPAVRRGDSRWETIVRFTLQALLLAEHKGITQAMVAAESLDDVQDPEARHLLGLDKGVGRPVGLDDAWGAPRHRRRRKLW